MNDDDALVLREVDELPLAGARAPTQRREHRDRAGEPAAHVGVREAPARRLAAGMAHQHRVSAERLQRRAEAHVVAVRARLAEARHRDRDDVPSEFTKGIIIEAEVRHHPRAEVVDHDVALGGEPLGDQIPRGFDRSRITLFFPRFRFEKKPRRRSPWSSVSCVRSSRRRRRDPRGSALRPARRRRA